MNEHNLPVRLRRRLFLLPLIALLCPDVAWAQREYTVIKPRERSGSEPVRVNTPSRIAPSKGQLVVFLNPIVAGQVVVKDAAGKIVNKAAADLEGQAVFQLPRGKSYTVEASYPGYGNASGKSKALAASTVVRLNLPAQYAALSLRSLPAGAQVFIDNRLRATVDQTGAVTIGEINPGDRTLRISHPEYNDYTDVFKGLEAGNEISYPRVPLRRVAKLTVQGPAGANVLIDGAFQGRLESNGQVQFDYELDRAADRTITVELVGYQTWTKRELLTPGPRTIVVSLNPVETSAGVTDFFDNLSLWNAPPTWKVSVDGANRRLQVRGERLGTLADKTYRDFRGNFTIWLEDGKGATWAVRADKEGRNYYLFHLAGPKSTSHTPRRFYTYIVKDGGQPVEVSTPIPVLVDLTQPGSYTISITVENHTIKHSIVGNHKVEESDLGIWTDTTITKDRFLYGSFGFRSLAGETFQVDDLNLEPVKEK